MTKRPAMLFYVGDWIKDPCVAQCSPATRGIYLDLLCAMHEADESGSISGTVEGLARIGRCNAEEMREAIRELESTDTAEITWGQGRGPELGPLPIVTTSDQKVKIANRRMRREYKSRQYNALKQRAHREREKNKQNVKEPSSSSSSSSISTSTIQGLVEVVPESQGTSVPDCINQRENGAKKFAWTRHPAKITQRHYDLGCEAAASEWSGRVDHDAWPRIKVGSETAKALNHLKGLAPVNRKRAIGSYLTKWMNRSDDWQDRKPSPSAGQGGRSEGPPEWSQDRYEKLKCPGCGEVKPREDWGMGMDYGKTPPWKWESLSCMCGRYFRIEAGKE